jgi:hypothetical protein
VSFLFVFQLNESIVGDRADMKDIQIYVRFIREDAVS